MLHDNSKRYFINYNKSRDACSIIWLSEEYLIGDLEPYIYSIQCDDGDDFHELINSDWPDAEGHDDFKTMEIKDFQALTGDADNEFLLCFTADILTDLDRNPTFKKVLEGSENQIIARIQFKKDGKPLLDEYGEEKTLYEMHNDRFVKFELDE
jgi:hypothetical protein